MLRIIRVTGESLSPAYRDGDYVLVVTIPFFLNRIRAGNLIIFRQEFYGLMIKKVEKIGNNGNTFFVLGTQENSTDSRKFGWVMREDIIGKVLWHIRKRSP